MKKNTMLLIVLSLFAVFCSACGQAPQAEDNTGLPNPLKETDAEGIMQTLGLEFGVPEGAGEVSYYIINDETAEMRFTVDTARFTARIKPSAEFEDISGMYYDWTATDDTRKVQHCNARNMSYLSETEDDVMVTLWYDTAPGLMYSLSAVDNDLNGLDLQVLANQIFIPVQENAG
ncbi:MAG: hypothetical protein IJJ67_08210 [Oscillospiraceae bacterium]|nr:hypothetical protein [Oscillospiraceae bacterium]